LNTSADEVLGTITAKSGFDIQLTQRDAWSIQIDLLQAALQGIGGTLLLEFDVPRIGSRIDAVVLSGPAIFVIEFKVGESRFLRDDINQVWDYALDLKNFHAASHSAPILPILVSTGTALSARRFHEVSTDGVFVPAHCSGDGLRNLLDQGLSMVSGPEIDGVDWARSPYRPTPTIIQAARALYAQHSVAEIARNDAGTQNLGVTSRRVEELIETARSEQKKIIVFVTGVPGAGKTLVGLDVATKKRDESPTHAVFLSGNQPLVSVLREALVRDELRRRVGGGDKVRKGEIEQKVKAFIQNIHHFRDAGLRDESPPADRVVIFDEAQRAWNKSQTANFMARRKKRSGFAQSEAELLISYLDRHRDWATVVCLVGGGQEINRGEAGISSWLDALDTSFREWTAYASPNLRDSEYDAGHAIERLRARTNLREDSSLHLAVSMRSFRAEHVSSFVKAVLDCDTKQASAKLKEVGDRYPIVITRDLLKAKQWVRDRARGSEKAGLMASSGAERLRPHAIDVRFDVNPVHWFLGKSDDPRSSDFLEDAATEFQVQGLEVDWACVTWDADLRFSSGAWTHHNFVGSKWQVVRKLDNQRYLRNAYRVLLTRARQGMAIFVPPGDPRDKTRQPEYYDCTFEYLAEVGITVL